MTNEEKRGAAYMTKLNPSETKVLTALMRTGGSNKELAQDSTGPAR